MPKVNKDLFLSLIMKLHDPYKTNARLLYLGNRADFNRLPASNRHHNNFVGGLRDHTINVMKLIPDIYNGISNSLDVFSTSLNFSLDETIYVGAIHDFGKVDQYLRHPKMDHSNLLLMMLKRNHIKISKDAYNAIVHHHGGYGPPGKLGYMAIIVHTADMIASQHLEKIDPIPYLDRYENNF